MNKIYEFRQSRFLSTLSNLEIFQLAVSGLVGLLICMIISAIGNAVLVEISINVFFCTYFGFCFIVIGFLLFLRVNTLPDQSQLSTKKAFLYYWCALVVFSGIVTFCLERDWNHYMNAIQKIPLYIILGISVNNTVTFGLIDSFNFLLSFMQLQWQRTMVETPNQIVCILGISTILGFIYGLFFSAMDIEDIRNFHNMERELMIEEKVCAFFASILGAIGGVTNEYLRIKGGKFLPFTFEEVKDPFTEEI